jgi:hypothetical protein
MILLPIETIVTSTVQEYTGVVCSYRVPKSSYCRNTARD